MGTTFNGINQNCAAIAGKKVRGIAKASHVIYRRPTVAVALTNMLSNGSFETNTTDWAGSGTLTRIAVPTPAHGEFGSWCAQNSQSVNGAHHIRRAAALTLVNTNRYYIRARVRYISNGYGNIVTFGNNTTALASGQGVSSFTMPAVNTWYEYDAIYTANTTSLMLSLIFTGGSGNQTRTAQIDNVMMINLTSAFGANVPTIADVREAIAANSGYWDGQKTIQI